MSRSDQLPQQLLDVLSCEIGQRPPGAPGIDDLRAVVRAVRREPGTLLLTLRAGSRPLAAAFVAAEQRCCSAITWSLSDVDPPELRIIATEEQVTALLALTGG